MHLFLIYIGILFGVFLEGEMIMISSIIAAHHGYLNIWLVVFIGILGTYVSDFFYFNLGRKKGAIWIQKNQKIRKKAAVVDRKLNQYPVLIFIIYRFMYGLRTLAPLVIGAGKTKTRTFLFYSGLSTLLWATLYGTIGYTFGALIQSQLSHIEHAEKYMIGILVFIAILILLKKRAGNKVVSKSNHP